MLALNGYKPRMGMVQLHRLSTKLCSITSYTLIHSVMIGLRHGTIDPS
jgi:hypothetical protein